MVNRNEWTPPQLIQWISGEFESLQLPEPHRLEAELLVSHALNCSRLELYLDFDKPTSKEERNLLRNLVRRRKNREPIAYILGKWEFYGISLKLGPGVLIPRPDTECLVDHALDLVQKDTRTQPYSILELGTGTAAIPLAITSNCNNIHILTLEKSAEALFWAKENINSNLEKIDKLNNQIHLISGDGFGVLKPNISFEMIISNPPYIEQSDLTTLAKEVSCFEPKVALDGGKDGLDFYHLLLSAAKEHLKPSGYLIFEHGFDQKEKIKRIMAQAADLKYINGFQDLNSNDRVLLFQKI